MWPSTDAAGFKEECAGTRPAVLETGRSQMLLAGVLVLLLASGCAGVPDIPDGGQADGLLQERGYTIEGELLAGNLVEKIARLERENLGMMDAVLLAVANNPGLRAQFAALGISAAEVYAAARLSNPSFSLSILFPHGSGSNEVAYGFTQSLTDLVLLPSRHRFSVGEYERARLLLAQSILKLVSETRSAWIRVVAARQLLELRTTTRDGARTAADLARRYFDAGNISRLELALEESAASQAETDLLRAEREMARETGVLERLLGFHAGEREWNIGHSLAGIPDDEESPEALLALGDARRMDLAAARKQVELLADAADVTRRFKWLGVFDLGVDSERESEEHRSTGPHIALELPIFNSGKGKVLRAEASLQTAQAQLQELETAVSHQIRQALFDLEGSRKSALHLLESTLPLRESIVQRTQEQVNYMLVGPFELFIAKQQEYTTWQDYIEAVRDYWLARIAVEHEVGTFLPGLEWAQEDPASQTNPSRETGDDGKHTGHGDHKAHGVE